MKTVPTLQAETLPAPGVSIGTQLGGLCYDVFKESIRDIYLSGGFMELSYIRADSKRLRDFGKDERWLQNIIEEDPTILGLGDLGVIQRERRQPSGGRIDFLMYDRDQDDLRYVIEVMLGRLDESHIIRTIEYWDIERKRYPQYDHTAVIIAEDITSRFFNVIGLFNGTIPLIAIQMNALGLDDKVGLVFTTVLNQVSLGLVDEDEETSEVTDRSYWESRGSKKTVEMADAMLDLARQFDGTLELKYNKFYIGLAVNGHANNYFIVRPKKNFIRFEPRLELSTSTTEKLESAGLDVMDYDTRWGRYRIRLAPGDIATYKAILMDIIGETM